MSPAAETRPGSEPASGLDALSSGGNPLLELLRQNASTLLAMAGILLLGALVFHFRPQMAAASRARSWRTFDEITQSPDTHLAGAGLAATLERVRDDERIYGWVVLRALNEAFRRGDRVALGTLRVELDRLAQDETWASLHLVLDGERRPVAAYLRDRVDAELSGGGTIPELSSLPPEGKRVELELSVGGTDTYKFVLGLYEGAAPEACRRFLAAIEAGSLGKAEWAGAASLRLRGLGGGAEAPEALPLERRWGCFHEAGVLATSVKLGAGEGLQDGDQLSFLLEDQLYLDGQTTVFAKVVEGESQLAQLAARARPADSTQKPPPVELVAVRVLD